MAHKRIILTIEQARELQRSNVAWPRVWAFLLDVEISDELTKSVNDECLVAGVQMLKLGCSYAQVQMQLNCCGGTLGLKRLFQLA